MTIRIEICKSWMEGKWCIRTGDLKGNSELRNVEKKEIIEEVREQIELEESADKTGVNNVWTNMLIKYGTNLYRCSDSSNSDSSIYGGIFLESGTFPKNRSERWGEEMKSKNEALILEALEMLLIFPESRTLEREKSLLIFKINQARIKIADKTGAKNV